jgi:ribosome-binding protein aMBF1 (putative translation factor)
LEFIPLALRAGHALDPDAADALFAWLDALKHHNPPSLKTVDRSDISMDSDGKEVQCVGGELHNLCAASADFCRALEIGTIQAEARPCAESIQTAPGQSDRSETPLGPRIETVAAQLVRLRQEVGWTEEELAEKIGITTRSVQRHLSGDSVPYKRHIAAYERQFSKHLKRQVVIKKMS